MLFRRHGDQQPRPQPVEPQPPVPAPGAAATSNGLAGHARPTPDPVRHNLAESAPLATTPMPYDVAADHEPVIVFSAGFRHVAELGNDPGPVLATVLEELGREASERGCDAVYSVHHTLCVDSGWIYITAMGTGSRPTPDLDGPPVNR